MGTNAKRDPQGEANGVGNQHSQYLTFSLSGEMYAIGILNIKEIMEYGGLTTIPMMPEFVRGVINLRGAVVPVVDLAVRFGRKSTEIGPKSCIVIVELTTDEGGQDLGVIVDSVSEVLEIPASETEPPPSFGARIRSDFIRGMGKVANKFVIILDVGKVLGDDDVARLGEMSAAAEAGEALSQAA